MGARAKCNYLSGVNLLKYLNIYFVIIDEYGLWCVLCVFCYMCERVAFDLFRFYCNCVV